MKVLIHTDGCSLGNPGPGGAAAVLETEAGEPLAAVSESLPHTTNNVAEYRAVLLGLRTAREHGAKTVEVRSDSELVVRQVRGEYRVKQPHLRPLVREVRALLAGFEGATLESVPREANREADRLAKAAAHEVERSAAQSGRGQGRLLDE